MPAHARSFIYLQDSYQLAGLIYRGLKAMNLTKLTYKVITRMGRPYHQYFRGDNRIAIIKKHPTKKEYHLIYWPVSCHGRANYIRLAKTTKRECVILMRQLDELLG